MCLTGYSPAAAGKLNNRMIKYRLKIPRNFGFRYVSTIFVSVRQLSTVTCVTRYACASVPKYWLVFVIAFEMKLISRVRTREYILVATNLDVLGGHGTT